MVSSLLMIFWGLLVQIAIFTMIQYEMKQTKNLDKRQLLQYGCLFHIVISLMTDMFMLYVILIMPVTYLNIAFNIIDRIIFAVTMCFYVFMIPILLTLLYHIVSKKETASRKLKWIVSQKWFRFVHLSWSTILLSMITNVYILESFSSILK